jgi:ABC-2 type transport system permease protein
MNATRVYAIFLRQIYLIRDNRTRFFQIFVWITVDIILWGFMSRYLTGISGSGLSFMPVLLGAVLLWDFLIRVMQGITVSFFEDVWSRNFLNIFASPLKVSEYIAGLVLSSIVTTAIGLIVMFFLAVVLFGFSIFSYGASLMAFLWILFLFGVALGIFSIGIVLKFGPSSEWFVWPIPAILSPFVGVFYPLSTLPPVMQYIARILPPSYVFEGVRAIVAGGDFPASDLVMGMALSCVYILLAYVFFLWVYRKAVRTGLIGRYSAETIS